MRKSLTALIAIGLVCGLTTGASAHIGDKVVLLFEASDADIADIDLQDGTVADWEDVFGEPNLLPADFYADPTVGDGAQYDPTDMDYSIWTGWRSSNNTVWFAMNRFDNVYFGREYDGSSPWNYEAIEVMLDSDHTGGDFTGSANPDWTDEEKALNNNRTAQQYIAVADDPSGRHVFYLGSGGEWVNDLPYADGGGVSVGDNPTESVIEFFCTPFDDLIWNSPGDSKAGELTSGKIIGFQISLPDTDQAVGQDRAFHTLSGQAATWRYAERFIDARLVGLGGGATAVEDMSWGRIKASLQ